MRGASAQARAVRWLTASAAAAALFVRTVQALACPDCKTELATGVSMGVGTTLMVMGLLPLMLEDVRGDDAGRAPERWKVALAAGGASAVAVAATAVVVASSQQAESLNDELLRHFAVWTGPPLVLGALSGFVAYSLLPPSRDVASANVAVGLVPSPRGASAVIGYVY